ncbi:MAG TPA: hypothetical protein VID19_10110 [Candidatus Eremiobacteraceae bacterium]|jgi:hypothetical protein
MSWIAIACAVIGAISCIIFALTCIRPALRLRGLMQRLQAHPVVQAALDARDASQSIASAAASFEPASRKIKIAAASIADAMASVAGYASQVAEASVVVDSMLGFVVPRLRGMLAKES